VLNSVAHISSADFYQDFKTYGEIFGSLSELCNGDERFTSKYKRLFKRTHAFSSVCQLRCSLARELLGENEEIVWRN